MGRSARVRAVRGPLAPWATGFEEWLAGRGFSPWTVRNRLYLFAVLSRWLERQGVLVEGLTGERAELFLAERRAAGLSTWVSPRCVALPLEYLREVGAVPPLPVIVIDDGPVGRVLAGYCEYLTVERGLAASTIDRCQRVARLFLEQLPDGFELGRLTTAEVSVFLARECPLRTGSGARTLVARFRPFLRYLYVEGLVETPLVWAVPAAASQRDRSLPRGLDGAMVRRLLTSCDRRRTVGRRDHAVLLLLVRLGLRAGEVAAIELQDIDWRRGEVLIHGKGNRQDRLPLPVDVGEALASYLQRRGRDECRAVFLKVHAPHGALNGHAVCGVVHDACVRAGVPPVGAHRLRHTAATGMLAGGASLEEIAQVLRHREIKTTAIYAKVDRARLRPLARPWPGVRS